MDTDVAKFPADSRLYILRLVVNSTVSVSGMFDFSDAKCKQHYMTAFNPFLYGTKNGDVDGTCERSLNLQSCRERVAELLACVNWGEPQKFIELLEFLF